MLGPLSSVIINRLGCRPAAFLGGLICVASLLLSSLPSRFPLLFLTYSFPFGFGSSCLFVSCYVIISQYFDKKRALATGIVASGTGVGVFAVAPICQSLLDAYDWRNTYRITAGYFSVVCILCLTFVPPMKKKADGSDDVADNQVEMPDEIPAADKPKKLLNFSIFKNKVYTLVTLSFTIAFFGHLTPRLHLVRWTFYIYKLLLYIVNSLAFFDSGCCFFYNFKAGFYLMINFYINYISNYIWTEWCSTYRPTIGKCLGLYGSRHSAYTLTIGCLENKDPLRPQNLKRKTPFYTFNKWH